MRPVVEGGMSRNAAAKRFGLKDVALLAAQRRRRGA
jgi:hypothetical protein